MRHIFAMLMAAGLALAEPATEAAKGFTQQQKRYWAFQTVQRPSVPVVASKAWARNPIDAFVLSRLEAKSLAPNPPAGKATLIRRAYLDMTGLPPSPDEVTAFLRDDSPRAFEKVVDRLLASKHYGERWARHWLDVARYADSEGFKADETRPNVWRYRDYVIDSFNQDKPYDRFVQEQIAGDEMFPNDPAAKVAVGFNRHFPDESNARNIMQRRQELLNDITDTAGYAFMAMTMGCARCHDHKFDPILQKDYYRLQAFFANTRIEDNLPLAGPTRLKEWEAKNAAWETATKSIRDEMAALLEPARKTLYQEGFEKFPPEIQDAVNTPADQRTPIQWHMFHKSKPQIEVTDKQAAAKLKADARARYRELQTELASFDSIKPEPMPMAQTMIDNGVHSPKTHVLSVGVYDAYREEVQPGFLTILDPTDAKITPPAGLASSGRRTALARWLTASSNPLTARVMVNRVWHHHFGRGIVGTPNDFGVMGERPTNRELLDWLTADFTANGWSLKKLHRSILLSNTYQQSSDHRADAAAADPDNKLHWRFSRRRIEGETIRDAMLQVSGVLNPQMGGPGVFPPLPPGMVTRGGWDNHQPLDQSRRRSIYTFVRRNTRYPMFEVFDMPDTHESCGRRNQTVTPTQALELLNNSQVVDWSKALAGRVANDSGMSRQSQVERAWRLVYARQPSDEEARDAEAFLAKQTALAGNPQEALADLCHMLLSSNEFLYLN
jgi:hypothetical protein